MILLFLVEEEKKSEYLFQHDVEFEIIPGVTSAIGSAVYAGIPLTHRKFASSVAIVTGHEDKEKNEPIVKWDKLVKAVDTIVIMMGLGQIEEISFNLIKSGLAKETEVAVIENGTDQRTTNNQRIIGKHCL